MRIGIDISQIAYDKTGVSNFLSNLLENLLLIDKENEYIFFFSSLRKNLEYKILNLTKTHKNLEIKKFRIPPLFLNLVWNKLHVMPIEWLIGEVDVFITSDWTEPPVSRAKKVTIIYDLIIKKYPNETDIKIVHTQENKIKWVKKESDVIICISKSTKKDVGDLLNISDDRIKVVYPGI